MDDQKSLAIQNIKGREDTSVGQFEKRRTGNRVILNKHIHGMIAHINVQKLIQFSPIKHQWRMYGDWHYRIVSVEPYSYTQEQYKIIIEAYLLREMVIRLTYFADSKNHAISKFQTGCEKARERTLILARILAHWFIWSRDLFLWNTYKITYGNDNQCSEDPILGFKAERAIG